MYDAPCIGINNYVRKIWWSSCAKYLLDHLFFYLNLKKLKFPVTLNFAMAIKKIYISMTIPECFGLNLAQPLFSHVQLNVSLSKVWNPVGLFILAPEGNKNEEYCLLWSVKLKKIHLYSKYSIFFKNHYIRYLIDSKRNWDSILNHHCKFH